MSQRKPLEQPVNPTYYSRAWRSLLGFGQGKERKGKDSLMIINPYKMAGVSRTQLWDLRQPEGIIVGLGTPTSLFWQWLDYYTSTLDFNSPETTQYKILLTQHAQSCKPRLCHNLTPASIRYGKYQVRHMWFRNTARTQLCHSKSNNKRAVSTKTRFCWHNTRNHASHDCATI